MTKSGIINPKSESTNNTNNISEDDQSESLRRGPWTLEEDNLLIQYVSCHGEGRWNSLAKYAGLKRTGKSCRLRWLNYLNPDIKRGNFTPHEQLLILELHSKWGNRWSKIAKHLPGRTDNEIKNYWRTRVQKQARQLQVDSNSRKFLEAARMFWTPRLVENTERSTPPSISSSSPSPASSSISTMDQALCHTKLPCPNSNYNNTTSAKEITNIQQLPPADADTLGNYKVILCDENPNEGSIHNFYEEDVRVKRLMEAQENSFYGCHMEEDDWFGEELGNGFWNYSDELWQFKRAEEIIGV